MLAYNGFIKLPLKMRKNLLLLGICATLVSGCVVICVGPQPPGPKPGPENESRHEALRPMAPSAKRALGGKPQPVNIDFGPGVSDGSRKTGAAAAGQEGDFWNAVARSFNSEHREGGIKTATGEPSPIEVELLNLGGCWGFSGGLGIKDPMLDDFNYPVNNQGGNSEVILHGVPPGKYDLYIYGHGVNPQYYGDYSLKVGERSYGRKTTFHDDDSGELTKWKEGWHVRYVQRRESRSSRSS